MPNQRDPVEVETIRHPVGEDGTMRYRFTFHVSIDPTLLHPESLGRLFVNAMLGSLLAAHELMSKGALATLATIVEDKLHG